MVGVFGRWKLGLPLGLPLVRSRVSKVLTTEPAHRGIKRQSCSQASRCGPEIMITRSGLDNTNIFSSHTPMTTAEFKLSPGPETPPISSDKKKANYIPQRVTLLFTKIDLKFYLLKMVITRVHAN